MRKSRPFSRLSGVLSTSLLALFLSVFLIVSCSVESNLTGGGGSTGSSSSSQEPDTNLPTVSITFPTNNHVTNGANIYIEGTASAPGTNCIALMEISLDGSTFYPVSGTNNWNTNITLTEGTNGLTARAVSGNLQTNTSATVIVRLDTISPSVNFTSVTNYEDVGATFELAGNMTENGSGPAHLYVRIDNGSWEEISFNASSPYPWTTNISLGEYGYHTNYSYAVDSIGNIGNTNFIIVNRAAIPSVVIDFPTSYQETKSTTVAIIGSSYVSNASITNVLLSTNGAPYVSVSTTSNFNVSWNNFALGTNSLVVKVIADNGKSNFSSTRYFIVDQTPPDAPSVAGVSYTSNVNPKWTWQSGGNGGNGTFRYKLDDPDLSSGATETVQTNYTATSLSDGYHTLYVQERDNAGNWSVSGPWTIDVFTGKTVYVSTAGNNTNRGTSTAPLYSIQIAVDKAGVCGATNVYVALGAYTPGYGLNSLTNGVRITNGSINLVGGFTEGPWTRGAGDMSVLDVQGYAAECVIMADNKGSINIDGFVIRGGNTAASSGPGGIYFYMVRTGKITNCVISNNSGNSAGGVLLYSCSNIQVNSIIAYNTSANNAGGIGITKGMSNLVYGSVFSNSAAGSGGGVYLYENTAGSLNSHAVFATVTGNSAVLNGGGVFNACSNTLLMGELSRNSAVNGGGLYIDDYGDKVFLSGLIFGNTAISNGGGVYMTSALNVQFSNNIVSNRAYRGGGIYAYSQFGNYGSHVLVQYNSAYEGGGVYGQALSNFINMDVCNNSACNGGGIYFADLLAATLTSGFYSNCQIYSNYATNAGGGVMVSNSCNFKAYNDLYYNTAAYGGGYYLAPQDLSTALSYTYLYGCISNNSADYGGGVCLMNQTNISVGAPFTFNDTTTLASGLYAVSCAGLSISSNYVTNYDAIVITNSTNITITAKVISNISTGIRISCCTNVSFSGVSAYSATGSGMLIYSSTNINLMGSLSNNASYGLYARGCRDIALQNKIMNNTGSSSGGGMYLSACDTVTCYSSFYVSNNTATTSGAGMYVYNTVNFYFNGGKVYGNTVTGTPPVNPYYGGGIMIERCSNVVLNGADIQNNVGHIGGGILFQLGTNNIISNSCLITSNYAKVKCGGLGIYGEQNFALLSSTLSNNSCAYTNTNSAVWLLVSGGNPLNTLISNNTIGGNGQGYGIIEDTRYSDVLKHSLVDNEFRTNTMWYIYRNFNGNLISNQNIAVLNSSNDTYHGATNNSGNTVIP